MKTRKILITIGIPASGKTTFANEYIKENSNFVKIERDEIRYSLKNIPIGDFKFENLVTKIQYNMIETSLKSKYDVLISDTNCNLKYLKQLVNHFENKANISFKLFDTPLETCIERDSLREKSVGSEVIKRMYDSFKHLKENFDFSDIEKKPFIYENPIYDPYLPDAIIVDIDGTIAHHNNKRNIYDFKNVGVDDVDFNMLRLIQSLEKDDVTIIYLTGRSEICYEETFEWLKKYDFPTLNFLLLMKKDDDRRNSAISKKELYDDYVKDKFNVICALEDRDDVTKMWRENNIKTLQVMYEV